MGIPISFISWIYPKKQPARKRAKHPLVLVMRFATFEGYIYLKHTPSLLALEASISQILYDQFHASVVKVIAHNAALNCFLMQDACVPLRKILKKQFNVTLLCKAIEQFSSMQIESYLKNYRNYETGANLIDALWLVYEALAQYRLRLACNEEKFLAFQVHGKLSARLKEFIAACSVIGENFQI